TPLRQPPSTKCMGERQCRRQTDLSGVSSYAPARPSRPATTYRPPRSHARNPGCSASRPRYSAYAATPNAVQTARYDDAKSHVGTEARPRRARSAETLLKSNSIGAAEGSIIATIIVTQTPRYQ